LVKAGAKP